MPADPTTDPILVKRARLARIVSVCQRLGGVLFLYATVWFFIGLSQGYTSTIVTMVMVGLFGGSALLGPAIILGYAVKAADREDAGLSSGH